MSALEGKMRVAVEGCGHGTLNAIYDAVERSCAEKGWDGVDVLIIGGDFQAVRNKRDLNVTAMPAKYREMADFHEYYSGARTAPVLTIFIGGNHEASNHLYELYYGGWVAPNIYYMGAANVIQIGNLRIAGMSGIWKGYDYQKPHHERLPYSHDEMYGIYHVRELDVRKLLAIRSQVDIGMSHDWPRAIEWSGNWQWLFKKKDLFQADAESGRLGSTAAKYVLERLRPKHWFSAHLHIGYEATYNHENPTQVQTRNGFPIRQAEDKDRSSYLSPPTVQPSIEPSRARNPRAEHTEQLSAWHGFQEAAKVADAEEQRRYQAAQEERLKENKGGPAYTFNETFKKIAASEGLERKVESKTESLTTTGGVPQLDGNCTSRPLKRQREESESPKQQSGSVRSPRFQALGTPWPRDVAFGNETMEQFGRVSGPKAVAENPDALDLDLTDEEDTEATKINPMPIAKPQDAVKADITDEEEENGVVVKPPPRSGSPFPDLSVQAQSRKSDLSEDGGVIVPTQMAEVITSVRKSSEGSINSSLSAGAKDFVPRQNGQDSQRKSSDSDLRPQATKFRPSEAANEETNAVPEVSAENLAELAGLSSMFVKPEKSADLPFPEDITNKITRFLALDKCLPGRHFLELLEIEPLSADTDRDSVAHIERPVKLRYDPEWLAIQRVFDPELKLGGNREDEVPPHRGDTYYDEQILESRKWVFEHIVADGKLEVPDNFQITASVFDPDEFVEEGEMPREVTNPQTTAFCELIGIDNKFDFSEEDRDARMLQGPKPSESRSNWRGKGRGGRGGGRGRGGGGGGRGGFGFNNNRGRGRGRGGGGGGRGFYQTR